MSPVKISMMFLAEIEKTHPEIHMESQGILNTENNLEKPNWKTHTF